MAPAPGPQRLEEKPEDRGAAASGVEKAKRRGRPKTQPRQRGHRACAAHPYHVIDAPPPPSGRLMTCIEAPEEPAPRQLQPVPAAATATNAADPAGYHHGSLEGDLECLVCREPYTFTRLPKLLGCQHTFCVVCLKLLLCVRDNIWSITCPLCRKVTAVPGGLICSLRNQEAAMGHLARPSPEVRLCPQGLEDPVTSAAGHLGSAGEDGQDWVSANHAAARRLAAHLLLLVLLIFLILPFVYPGVVRWVLAFIISLALLMSTLFCCHPSSQGRCQLSPRTLFCRKQTHSQISSIA
ncbi:E3 ubiquitin-protein ligase RNF186 [Choloepus didactylus]|uniref:E3 ubiquitin-protein ligase RNF186 n=1 Tax=Choloepus didactylus TaxID=27675 RepID=UPI00189D123B|nr:E3 ubiquitin-protein ligase RNF186 [Choloepus didactylus]